MRLSTVLSGAVAVSASCIIHKRAGPLSLEEFGHVNTLSLEDARIKFKDVICDVKDKVDDVLSGFLGIDGSSKLIDTGSDITIQSVTDDVTTQATCTSPIVRVEWRNMADADKLSFVNAVSCLMGLPASGAFPGATNRYEDIVAVHQLMNTEVHLNGIFLPWHRYFLWTFSRMLRSECAYAAPLPWWDETKDAGNFANSGLFTDQYFGALPPATNGGACVVDGAFGGTTLNIGPGSTNRPHCLQRAGNDTITVDINQSFVDTCSSITDYAAMEECNEKGPHGLGHNGIGAVMAEVSASPGDPVFFMHHSFVDHMWRQWQNKDPARLTTIDGCTTPDTEACTPLSPDTVLSSMGLRDDVTVAQMLDITADTLCYTYDY